MALSKGDFYKVVLKGVVLGQPMANVLYFVRGSAGGSATELGNQIAQDWSLVFEDLLSAQATYTEIEVENLTDPTNFDTVVWGALGTEPAECMPPFVAYAFKKFTTDKTIRTSGIRIAGVPEVAVNNGVITNAYLTKAQAVATVIQTPLIASGIVYNLALQTPGNSQTGGVWKGIAINTVQFDAISSQNSRKFK